MKNFKVGQKVRIMEKDLPDAAQGFTTSMALHFEDVVTIREIRQDCFGRTYVKVEENGFSWDERFLEPVKTWNIEHKDKLRKFNNKIYHILPLLVLKKVIENDRTVICFFETSNGNIKTISRCHEDDVFDLDKGVEVCIYKALRKVVDKELKKY